MPRGQPTLIDRDPDETQEWLEALDSLLVTGGPERAHFVMRALDQRAMEHGVVRGPASCSPYTNTISVGSQGTYPGDESLEARITAIMRWNALAMVVRANRAHGELGGHIATYASAAEIFEVGFNHFFRGAAKLNQSDLVFFQPHSAPGVYARAFLEGRLSETQLANFRQEISGDGLSAYPHPWLMPRFWQFPTGSMGLGPITSIYQARFMRYLEHRGIIGRSGRQVWGIFGDGEMDEPESIAALGLAAREGLDNLTFIINCNFQRLDGPVRGNGQIIQELESLFAATGWNVIKVVWGSEWDPLFERDSTHALIRRFATMVDGELQTLGANDGPYNRAHFFEKDPDLRAVIAAMSDSEVESLRRGGHDFRKLHAAFQAAKEHRTGPTVILAATKKGYGMGRAGESRMIAHQQKKLDLEALVDFRDRFHLPLSDEDLAEMRFYKPAEDGPELAYLRERRAAMGGYLPSREVTTPPIAVPPAESYLRFALETNGKDMSTTVAAVRVLTNLLKDGNLGRHIVPIVADEARTFGMANLFRQVGIYAPFGQLYRPEDSDSLLAYRETSSGQILEEGITEAGAVSSWIAAATAYAVHGIPILPIYMFYSMFGFQRVGDLIWAAADQRARGFLIGATSGRTTLGGEGLQHQDGSSHVSAAMVPSCRAYDPAFVYELALILDHGAREILEQRQDVIYYVTVTNEVYSQPSLPDGVEEDVIRGMYLLETYEPRSRKGCVRLLGSGAILNEVIAAARLLHHDWGVGSQVWSVTSFSELERDARQCERWNRLHPTEQPQESFVKLKLTGDQPVIAASDYVRAYPQLIAPYVNGLTVLGTDGFGRSDTRSVLRRFFEVDRHQIVLAALHALVQRGSAATSDVERAIRQYNIEREVPPPWTR